MRYFLLALSIFLNSDLFAKDAKQGIYIPPSTNDPRLKEQIVRMTLGDNEKTAIVRYKFGSITRLVFPTDTNTASCEVDSKVVKVENPQASDSLKGKKMFFRRITIKTVENAGSDFTAAQDKILDEEFIKVLCFYERFNTTYERVIMVKVQEKTGYGVVFFEHPNERFIDEYRKLRTGSVREIVYDRNGDVIKDRKKDILLKNQNLSLPKIESKFPILIVPVDHNRSPYWRDRS